MDNQKYIKVSSIYKKLREAESLELPLYISGAVGYGKTAAVAYFYRKKAYLLLNGESGSLDQMPPPERIRQEVIVVDNLSWISDETSMQYLIQLVKRRKINHQHIVLIGRSRLPGWLGITAAEDNFLFASEENLMLSKNEMEKFLESRGITASEEELNQIYADCYGHPLTLRYLSYHLTAGMTDAQIADTLRKGSCGYNQNIAAQVQLDLYHHYDHAFYEKWDSQMREVLLAVCQYPVFTIRMTEMITENKQVPRLFEQAISIGNFLIRHDTETYSYRTHLRLYFQWKQALLYTPEQIAENYERAAEYYKETGDIIEALKCYQAAGDEDRISEILIENSFHHPGNGQFFELREYYFSLPEETILASPILMGALSMLCALMFRPDKSNSWMDRLAQYEKQSVKGTQKQKEAASMLAYLNIALPQKGIHGIIKLLKNTAILCLNKQLALPEFSVTGNLPSIMNGGLDFCEWSRNDRELGIVMKKPLEIVLGKYGVGLINIALAESGMEKGTMNSYEIMTRLNNGYLMSDTGGRIELCFAATGLMIKEHLFNGQTEIGESTYSVFYKKVMQEKKEQLLPNMRTFHMWMQLVQGNIEEGRKWMEQAPDDRVAFCILDRYHHINKIRCLIALDRREEALALGERLNLYFTQYERHYLWMENQILKSIILYRKGMTEWQEILQQVLTKAQRYHLVRIFALEGNAVKPLLDRLKPRDLKPEYWNQIKLAVNQMALYYPNYLKKETILDEPLTDTESYILKLLCSGAETKEICAYCRISYNGYKFHARNIYRKLDVSTRADAEREAKRLGLS